MLTTRRPKAVKHWPVFSADGLFDGVNSKQISLVVQLPSVISLSVWMQGHCFSEVLHLVSQPWAACAGVTLCFSMSQINILLV